MLYFSYNVDFFFWIRKTKLGEEGQAEQTKTLKTCVCAKSSDPQISYQWPRCIHGHFVSAQQTFVQLKFKAWRVTKFVGGKDGETGFPNDELARRVLPFGAVQLVGPSPPSSST